MLGRLGQPQNSLSISRVQQMPTTCCSVNVHFLHLINCSSETQVFFVKTLNSKCNLKNVQFCVICVPQFCYGHLMKMDPTNLH